MVNEFLTRQRHINMWPVPDPEGLHAARREAVTAVLAKYEPSVIVSDELLDELVAAADTGI